MPGARHTGPAIPDSFRHGENPIIHAFLTEDTRSLSLAQRALPSIATDFPERTPLVPRTLGSPCPEAPDTWLPFPADPNRPRDRLGLTHGWRLCFRTDGSCHGSDRPGLPPNGAGVPAGRPGASEDRPGPSADPRGHDQAPGDTRHTATGLGPIIREPRRTVRRFRRIVRPSVRAARITLPPVPRGGRTRPQSRRIVPRSVRVVPRSVLSLPREVR